MCDCLPLPPFPHESFIRSQRIFPSKSSIRSTQPSAKINGAVLPNPPNYRVPSSLSSRKPKFLPTSIKKSLSTTISVEFHGVPSCQCATWGPSAARTLSSIHAGSNSANESPADLLDSTSGEGDTNPAMAMDADQVLSTFDFLELKRELEKEERGAAVSDDDDLVPMESSPIVESGSEEGGGVVERTMPRGGRQMMRRSNLLAKQVISIQSAFSLGFVSQLWVDIRSWEVILVEVRPSLLSGEIEKFLLEDVYQVGDVVLVKDERVMELELKMIGLDTLVGYNVITSGRKNVGKVRGYTFNINSGVVESLEIDSFGISLIPVSWVSTYSLLVEDVVEVVSDTIVVHEGAPSRLQRLTKGIWDTRNINTIRDQMNKRSNYRGRRVRFDRREQHNKKNVRTRENEDDWELPMDY